MAKCYTTKVDNKCIVDMETGECTDYNVTVYYSSADEFISLYLHTIPLVKQLTNREKDFLLDLLVAANFNPIASNRGNLIFMNAPDVDSIKKEYGAGNISSYMKKLVSLDLVQKEKRSVYLLNPLYFYRGKITDRTKVLIRYENMKKDNNDSIRV
jgi:hypothetical protein